MDARRRMLLSPERQQAVSPRADRLLEWGPRRVKQNSQTGSPAARSPRVISQQPEHTPPPRRKPRRVAVVARQVGRSSPPANGTPELRHVAATPSPRASSSSPRSSVASVRSPREQPVPRAAQRSPTAATRSARPEPQVAEEENRHAGGGGGGGGTGDGGASSVASVSQDGAVLRDATQEADAELHAAATKLQAVHRGRATRRWRKVQHSMWVVVGLPTAIGVPVDDYDPEAVVAPVDAVLLSSGEAVDPAAFAPQEIGEKLPPPQDALDEVQAAATKVQAVYRGRAARRWRKARAVMALALPTAVGIPVHDRDPDAIVAPAIPLHNTGEGDAGGHLAPSPVTQWTAGRRQKIRSLGSMGRTLQFFGAHVKDMGGDVDGDGRQVAEGALGSYAGLGSARCISMRMSVWDRLRDKFARGLLRQSNLEEEGEDGQALLRDARSISTDLSSERLHSGMSFGDVAATTIHIAGHTAVVFDCTDEGTTVMKLGFDSGRVVVSTIAECAGVKELLERNAGRWFATFAKEIKRHTIEQATSLETLDVVMVGTYAWHHQGPDAARANRNSAKELVSDLTRDGMMCKKLDGAEQALFEAVAVRDASCRHGLEADAIIGSGSTWVHCVRTGEATGAPVVLCNDDSSAGWQEGLALLRDSDDPLRTLEDWRVGTVQQLLKDNAKHRRVPMAELKVTGEVIVTSSGYYAACLIGLESGPAELRPVSAAMAIEAFSSCLMQCRIEMQEHLLAWKTCSTVSPEFQAAEELARNLCNLTLQIELLTTLLEPENTTVYFKREWTIPLETKSPFPPAESGCDSDDTAAATAAADATPFRPTWSTGWYMHLLHSQFGIQFPNARALIEHLDSLQQKARQYAAEYAKQHSGGDNSQACEAVALKLVAVNDVVGTMLEKAHAVEVESTGLLQQLCADAGGRMHGLDFRFKTESSLFRKLIARLDRQLKGNEHIPSFVPSLTVITREVDDCLRYTIVLPTERYTDGVQSTLASLTDAETGIASEVWIGNFWSTEPNCTTYMGINSFVKLRPEKSPESTPYTFELQFHTEESIALKDGHSHELYELFRSPGLSQEAKLEYYRQLKEIWNEVAVPPNIDGYGSKTVFLDKASEVLLMLQGGSREELTRTTTVPARSAHRRGSLQRAGTSPNIISMGR